MSDPADDLLAEQPLGPHEQEKERKHVREPAFYAATDIGPEKYLGELFRRTDDEAADDRARNRFEAAEDQHGQCLQRDERQRKLHAVARTPQHARDERDEAGDRPDDAPDLLQRNADGECRLMIVGDGAQRAADPRAAEEEPEPGDEHRRDAGGDEIELRHVDAERHRTST